MALAAGSNTLTVLLMGVDEQAAQVAGDTGWGRSDAMIIGSVNLDTGETRMASIDRDYLVTLPDNLGRNKLCTALYFGGPRMSLDVVNELFETDIRYYAAIDVTRMNEIIDALGGLEVMIYDYDLAGMRHPDGSVLFTEPGLKKMDGVTAAQFMRNRDPSDERSDLNRTERQRRVLIACMDKIMLLNSDGLMDFADAALPMLDTNITMNELTSVMIAVMMDEIKLPEQMRSPMGEYHMATISMHRVVVAEDMAYEIAELKKFIEFE